MSYRLLRGTATTDATSEHLTLDQSVLVENRTVVWIKPSSEEGDLPAGVEVIDASGSTLVPAMVDAHSHLTLPGGAHWIARIEDAAEELLAAAERNGDLLVRSGVRWARDVGSPSKRDPSDDRERALALGVRDRWSGRTDRPYVRAAGTWISKVGTFADPFSVEADDGDQLQAAVLGQLDDGADLIKLYLDGPDAEVSPFTAGEVAQAVAAAHERGAKVTAHSTRLHGAQAAVHGGVDSIEHGDQIDAELAAEMASRGTFLVTTHSVYRSWQSFGHTTDLERFAGSEAAGRIAERYETARESTRIAHAAGVKIATGSDFGGGSVRAGHLAWEVEALVEAGLQPWEALAAATWRGGELLGEEQAGVVTAGGPSDFFLVHGDPLSDPSALWRVWYVG